MKKELLFACVAILSLSACSNVETPVDLTVNKEIAFKPITNVNSRSIVTNTTMPTERKIKASASYINNSGNKVTYFEGAEFLNSSSTIWSCSTKYYWPLNDGVDFLAYTLTDNSKATSVTWDGTAAAQSVSFDIADGAADADDILYAAANNQKKVDATVGVGMKFNHAQANLNFTIITNVDVTIHSITFDEMYTGGKLTIDNSKTDLKATWLFSATAKKKPVPGISDTNVTAAGTSVALGTSLLVPQQDAVGFTIDYTIGGNRSTYKVPVLRQVWEMGKKYTYAIEINFKEITINPSVTDWDQSGENIKI